MKLVVSKQQLRSGAVETDDEDFHWCWSGIHESHEAKLARLKLEENSILKNANQMGTRSSLLPTKPRTHVSTKKSTSQ